MAIERMRHRLLVLRVGPGRQHAKITVDLHGIGVHHHASASLGPPRRKRGLAASRGACEQDYAATLLRSHCALPLEPICIAFCSIRCLPSGPLMNIASLIAPPDAPVLEDTLLAYLASEL